MRFHADPPKYFADKLLQAGIAPDMLEIATRRYSIRRGVQLRLNPIAGDFDLPHLCRIHQYLFGDVSSYAGSVRQYGLKRKDTDDGNPYARPWDIVPHFAMHVQRIALKVLGSNDHDYVVTGLAHLYNAVNYAHPFCDGNGRANREFVETLANRKHLSLRLEQCTTNDKTYWYEVCHQARNGSPDGLMAFFHQHAHSLTPDASDTTETARPIPSKAQVEQWRAQHESQKHQPNNTPPQSGPKMG